MEIWKDVPRYNGLYQASSEGRIRSAERIVIKRHRSGSVIKQKYSSRILEGTVGKWGHKHLHISVSGVKKQVAVHRLVLEAFVGMCPKGMEACHNNGDAADNRICNLRWDTHFANNQDRKRHGRYFRGEDHPMAKLTAQQVSTIRHSSEQGRRVAEIFGVSPQQISRIRSNKAWEAIHGTEAEIFDRQEVLLRI